MAVMTGMSGTRRAAILTLLLGEEGARGVFKCLRDDEVERLAREVATLDEVQPSDSEKVLTEFHKQMSGGGFATRGGPDALRRLLDKSLAPEPAKEM